MTALTFDSEVTIGLPDAPEAGTVIQPGNPVAIAVVLEGPQGIPGPAGEFPAGGTTGQALVKASDDDGDVEWGDAVGGGGGGSDVTLDADGTLTVDATTVELATDAQLAAHTGDTANPHSVTKTQVGLGSVDNTSDAAKPVSTATQTALDLKAPIASPTFTGTVAGVTKSHVGLGNVDNTADTAKPVSTAQQTALDLKAPLASPTFTGTVSGVTKSHVGLGNVDNTADASKPVSTLQAAADTAVASAAASALSTHEADTTSVHGIADTTALLTTSTAPELIRDTIATALVAGTNVTITPNDGADTITIAATGGGGGAVATDTIFDAKGDLPVGTGSNTAAKLTVGANGSQLVADSTQTTGLRYAAQTGIIGYCQYAPVTGIAKSISSTTSTDVDATNMVVTFTAPQSGNVLVTLSAYCSLDTASSTFRWGLRAGSSDVTGSYAEVLSSPSGGPAVPAFVAPSIVMTGLTAGTSYTWKWAFKRGSGSAICRIFVGLDANGGTGPATMIVQALP